MSTRHMQPGDFRAHSLTEDQINLHKTSKTPVSNFARLAFQKHNKNRKPYWSTRSRQGLKKKEKKNMTPHQATYNGTEPHIRL